MVQAMIAEMAADTAAARALTRHAAWMAEREGQRGQRGVDDRRQGPVIWISSARCELGSMLARTCWPSRRAAIPLDITCPFGSRMRVFWSMMTTIAGLVDGSSMMVPAPGSTFITLPL